MKSLLALICLAFSTNAGEPPPRIEIFPVSANRYALQWPSNSLSLHVENSTDISLSSGWTPVNEAPLLIKNKYQLTVSNLGSRRYFRLSDSPVQTNAVEIAQRLAAGESVKQLRDMRGMAYAVGASESPPADAIVLPSFAAVSADKPTFADARRLSPPNRIKP